MNSFSGKFQKVNIWIIDKLWSKCSVDYDILSCKNQLWKIKDDINANDQINCLEKMNLAATQK